METLKDQTFLGDHNSSQIVSVEILHGFIIGLGLVGQLVIGRVAFLIFI